MPTLPREIPVAKPSQTAAVLRAERSSTLARVAWLFLLAGGIALLVVLLV